jgi:hypothetical protein
MDIDIYVFLISETVWSKWSASRTGRFTPSERAPHTPLDKALYRPQNGSRRREMNKDLLKGSDDGVQYSEYLRFWTLSNVRYPGENTTQRFWNWICFRPRLMGETPTLLGR